MTALKALIGDYLAVRRSLGFKLVMTERLLYQFQRHVDQAGLAPITVDVMLQWAVAPQSSPNRHGYRLGTLRTFARWAHVFDLSIPVPPANLLPIRQSRKASFLYSPEQLQLVLQEVSRTPDALIAATYGTLIGLLACTGLRVGEAIRLNRGDLRDGVLTITDTKFGKSRFVPLDASVVAALARYQALRDGTLGAVATDALFVSRRGTRLIYKIVHLRFHRHVLAAGITAHSTGARPRIHDLRHTFAVTTMLNAYRDGRDPAEVLPILSTYLGHVGPLSTYWYLQADPQLLATAATKLIPLEVGFPAVTA